MIAERSRGDRRRGGEPRPRVHAVQAGQGRPEADARFLGHDHHVRRAAERVRPGQRHRAGAQTGAFVARAGETRDQPADRKRPGQPDRDARVTEQPVQAVPGRAERGEQRVDLAVPVTAPGAGPCGGLVEGSAASGAGRRRVPVTVLAHAYPQCDGLLAADVSRLTPFADRTCGRRPSLR